MSATPEIERLKRRIEKLPDGELMELHRFIARRANPVYVRIYRGNWEAGVNAAKDKQRRGWLKHERARKKAGVQYLTRQGHGFNLFPT